MAVVRDHGFDEATIKRFKKVGTLYVLQALNPKYEEIVLTKKHRIIGKVIKKETYF